MQIYVSRDGQQFGPYTLEEIKAYVTSGQLFADDLAWHEGMEEWKPLSIMLSFSAPPPPIRTAAVAPQSPATSTTPEETIFQGSESQVLNLKAFITWSFLFALIFAGLMMTKAIYSPLAISALIPALWSWLKSKMTRYTITNQRVKIERGVFSKRTDNLELYRVKDVSIQQPLFLRLFGRGNISLLTSDKTTPHLLLKALPKPVELCEKIRFSVERRRAVTGTLEVESM